MDIEISHSGFIGRGLILRQAGFFSGPKLFIDASEIKKQKGIYNLKDNAGNSVELKIKSNGIDPIPQLFINGEKLEIARPLFWYEYLWMGLPIVLVFAGGGLGALFGMIAIYSSARIFRSDRNLISKYVLSALISIGTGLVFFILAGIIHIAVYGVK